MNKIYVIAGTHQEYETFIRRKAKELWDEGVTEVTLSHFVNVRSVDQLRGLTECNGFYIGTYLQRPDLNEIQTQIQIIKSRQFGKTITGVILDEWANQ